jgi:hypothetical protein
MEYLYIIIIIFFPFLLLFSVYKRDIFLYDRNSIFVSQKKKKSIPVYIRLIMSYNKS